MFSYSLEDCKTMSRLSEYFAIKLKLNRTGKKVNAKIKPLEYPSADEKKW